jgi:aminoglycoside phosphotransferase (APT) family kinase protein
MTTPTENDAATIVRSVLSERAQTITRFKTGLRHYVYDVVTESNAKVVVRIARKDDESLNGAVYWYWRLRPLGVPLPRLLHADIQGNLVGFPFVVLERLPGRDLGDVYSILTLEEKLAIASSVFNAQTLVHGLPPGNGFGYATSYEDPLLHGNWCDVIFASLDRSRKRMTSAAVFDPLTIDQVVSKLSKYERYLSSVQPRAFLDDTTTKNVIVSDGRLSGIVDVDVVCFGDPLWTIGLTQMALLSRAFDLDYVYVWSDLLKLTAEQRQILKLYALIFCADFMSEVGHTFNQEEASVDQSYALRLTSIFGELLRAV